MVSAETISIPKRSAYWVRLPNHSVRVYLATVKAVPSYADVFSRGLDWPSLASAVTALEVDHWNEIARPMAEGVVLDKTA